MEQHDARLRDEIRWLGDLLGGVLRDQEGSEAFALVEEVRALARARRRGEEGAEAELVRRIGALELTQIEPLIQALSVFFDLANLAEDRQRVRVIRDRRRLSGGAEAESIQSAIEGLRRTGMTSQGMQELLKHTGIEFVFTAHPTEAKRRSVREKVRDLRGHLYDLDSPDLLPPERDHLARRVEADLTGLWQTDFVRFRRPTVLEELDRSLFFAGNLWNVVPELYREMRNALAGAFPDQPVEVPPLLRFGSWIGGDRDGNPFVTSQVTQRALRILRREALRRHAAQARRAHRNLGVSSRKVGVSDELLQAVEGARTHWREIPQEVANLSDAEPYRHWLKVIRWRLARTAEVKLPGPLPEGAYRSARELVDDIAIMRRSLSEHGGALLAESYLEDWSCQAEIFGFSLMRLDIRQEKGWYHRVLAELLAEAKVHSAYSDLSEDDRARLLSETIPFRGTFDEKGLSPETAETLSLFRLLAASVQMDGGESLGVHIVSMTHHPGDLLAVLWLAGWAAAEAGLPDDHLPIPIAPLFETIDDLDAAPATLDGILRYPAYRRHLRALGDLQMVMVGYSDSTKDGGYLAACWNLYEAQTRLQKPAEEHGIGLVFFHGRGGALGRGGGPAARQILSLPPGTVQAGLRVTEQGEVLAERYDDPRIARRHLEQMLSAVLTWRGGGEAYPLPESHRALLRALADHARRAYRELVERPGFIEYFEGATPIAQIEELPIGSRPSRRRGERSLETLRAIPWVFSWTQSRQMIPAWYGLGTALSSAMESDDGAVRALYAKNAFFRATIDNAVLALAKADMAIARLHSDLVEDAAIRADIWGLISAEYDRTRKVVLDLIGQRELLDNTPWLKHSIEVRNPYVDPLNLIQVELFRRLRRAQPDSPEANRAAALIRLTIQGIAGGLRTTG